GFFLAMPMSMLAAKAGISTTCRALLDPRALLFPKKAMIAVSLVGALTALLGVARPAREATKLDVAKTLMPRFLEDRAKSGGRRTRAVIAIGLPFAMLLYLLMRPFFKSALPSLTF